MLVLIIFIVSLALVLALDLLLPGIAFFSTGLGWEPIGAAFSGEGWNRAWAYLTSSPNWDRWLVIIAAFVMVILWVVLALIKISKGHFVQGITPVIGVALNLAVMYIYLAWPNPEVFQQWQKILLYITFCFPTLTMLVQILKAANND